MADKKKPETVVAVTSALTQVNGLPVHITQGESYRADDPVVKRYPSLFQDPATFLASRSMVEQATASPGEVRNVAVPSKA